MSWAHLAGGRTQAVGILPGLEPRLGAACSQSAVTLPSAPVKCSASCHGGVRLSSEGRKDRPKAANGMGSHNASLIIKAI